MRRRNVVNGNIFNPRFRKLGGKNFRRILRVPVYRTVENGDALFFGLVRAPRPIVIQIFRKVLAPDRTVQRADKLDIQSRRLFYDVGYLNAVFADDIKIVSARVV